MSERQVTFRPSGFFVLRTPLLPFDGMLAWGEGLEAPGVWADPGCLEKALATDRTRLRCRLRETLARPEVQEALFIASPDLIESLERWVQEPDSERGQKIERSLVRYVERMAGRATPFGLFAGCSVGMLGPVSQLTLGGRPGYQRHTRLDMDYLFALTEVLGRRPALRQALVYRPNSSLYRAAGRVRYAEARVNGKVRSYHLVAVDDTDYLQATLNRAEEGAKPEELAAAIIAADPEIPLADAQAFVEELIDGQLLVPDLAPAVTGPEPIHGLVARLQELPPAAQVAGPLDRVREALGAMDDAGLGIGPEHYRALAQVLAELPVKVEMSRLFQVDMVKPAPGAALSPALVGEIERGVQVLHRLTPRPRQDLLGRFREAFLARYEDREVPLVEALDEEVGIGFEMTSGPAVEASSLLDGLIFPQNVDGTMPWGPREAFLLRKVAVAVAAGAQEIRLASDDLDALATPDPLPLPGAFAAFASVSATSEAALDRGDFQVLLQNVAGPSGARLLGRFCHTDPVLQRHVEQHLRAEEALEPDAVFAEVVHLPEGRIGNILCRPVLRRHEIPFLGNSGAPSEYQMPITDLMLSVVGGEVVLRSARLGCRVFPRLSSAHNYAFRSLGIYKFLCALQGQGAMAGLAWDWGALESFPFLPRVATGRVVLARARWLLSRDEVGTLTASRGAELFRAAQVLRAARRLPRFVLFVEGDNELPVDFDNVLSLAAFVDLIKGRSQVVLVEMFPGPDRLCVHGPEGRFVHELIVPFVGTHSAGARLFPPAPSVRTVVQRSFPPGSEWLYAKLYTGTATADQVLREVIRPVTDAAERSGAADQWFFIRYGDPDWHLRLRFHGDPRRLHIEVLPALQAAVAPLLANGRLWRVQLDTYEREVERYGGGEGVRLAEQFFHADSEAVLTILEGLTGDAGAEARWRLALCGMDMLLGDLGFDLEAKRAIVRRVRDGFAREFRVETNFKRQLDTKYRRERRSLEPLLDRAHSGEGALAPALRALDRRSEQLAPAVAELRGCEQAGRLALPLAEIAPSYIHMHANRLLRSAQRAQELVLYDFLDRLYESRAARKRGTLERSTAWGKSA